jgi:hypothetical protein
VIKRVILRPFSPNILFVALLRFVNFVANVIKSTSFFRQNKKFKQVLKLKVEMLADVSKFSAFIQGIGFGLLNGYRSA